MKLITTVVGFFYFTISNDIWQCYNHKSVCQMILRFSVIVKFSKIFFEIIWRRVQKFEIKQIFSFFSILEKEFEKEMRNENGVIYVFFFIIRESSVFLKSFRHKVLRHSTKLLVFGGNRQYIISGEIFPAKFTSELPFITYQNTFIKLSNVTKSWGNLLHVNY